MTLKELSQLNYLKNEIEMDKERLVRMIQEIEHEETLLAELIAKASSVSSPSNDGMPKSNGSKNRLEEAVARILEKEELIKSKRALYSKLERIIQEKCTRCDEERVHLELYIAGIPDSLIRQIFTYHFIDGMSWRKVSESIKNVYTTEDSVKKLCYRYLAKQ